MNTSTAKVSTKTIKVYKSSVANQERHPLYVQPGKVVKDVSQWMNAEGKPMMITVVFEHGVATVDETLGRFLIDQGLATPRKMLLS